MGKVTPFLRQVAAYALSSGDTDRCVYVFPNRRSTAFFIKYLGEQVTAPVLAPQCVTINDFFAAAYGRAASERVPLLLKLYDCYKTLNPQAESLDDFIFWGDVILQDFNDVDKYLADPRAVFTNVAEFKQMQDDFSYLTPTQREAVEHFTGLFTKGDLRALRMEDAGVKQRFLQVWNLLGPLYRDFNAVLRETGMAYEGMIYRDLAEKMRVSPAADLLRKAWPGAERFVFVGLNALNACESTVMKKMRDAALAQFVWDYTSAMIRDPHNKSSVFMEENVRQFPQAFTPDPDGLETPEIHVVSVPSASGQAKQLPRILEGASAEAPETAVVLPDEQLLLPVLNTLPESVRSVNVTMGCPMSGSEFHFLMGQLAAMQIHLRRRDDVWLFYHRQVWAIFSNGVFDALLDEDARKIVEEVKSGQKYYIPSADLTRHPLFAQVFRPVVTDPRMADAAQVRALETYLRDLAGEFGRRMRDVASLTLELDFAKIYYQAVNQLLGYELPVLPATAVRLLDQMVAGQTVPFSGEPLRGLQVMGPLETRALDFRTLVVLSCNEGTFPRRRSSSSFIPKELRKGFDLPTHEYQDAVWAYYFYRMIQRAEQVWLVYDSRTEKLGSGEESRYIKQLRYHFRLPLREEVAQAAPDTASAVAGDSIPKTAEDLAAMHARPLSASSLQNWLACPARFYYSFIKGLKSEAEVAENLDASMIGNVYHATMQALYLGPAAMNPSLDLHDRAALKAAVPRPLERISRAYLEEWSGRQADIKARIRSLICQQMHTLEVTGRDLIVEDVLLKYVLKTLERDRELLDRYGTDSFRILGLEREKEWSFAGFRFKGYLDRLDSFRDGQVRVVDYKTGKVTDTEQDVTDANAPATVEALFGPVNKNRPKIALQMFLYDMYVAEDVGDAQVVNAVYAASRLFTDEVVERPRSEVFCREALARLKDLLAEMDDPAQPFRRTTEADTCETCDFKMICGR